METPLIYACSGGSDVGALADLTGRKLARDGHGKMHCLAGVGGNVPGILVTMRAADGILAIDGCGLACASTCLKAAGVENFRHLRLADMGFEKGKSPATEEALARTSREAQRLITADSTF